MTPAQIAFAIIENGATLKIFSAGKHIGNASIGAITPPEGNSYLRPGGVSTYLRPDSVSIYDRPE